MNTSRRAFLVSSSLGITGVMLGCTSPKLIETSSYTEEVSSVLMSEDKKILVVMTKNYHYIFEAPTLIAQTLGSSFHRNISGSLDSFYVDSSGVTTGKYNLLLGKNASEQEQKEALRYGYTRNSAGIVSVTGVLKGKRYRADGIQGSSAAIKLNRTYKVQVTEEHGSAKNVPSTPISEGAKGALVLATLPLFLVGIFFVCLVATVAGGCKN